MNKFVFVLTLLFNTPLLWRGAGGEVFAQINLVPNGGFELYSTCPTVSDNITEATSWLRFRSTPDYYNACALSGGMSVPNTVYGFQNSHYGFGMAGIVTYDKNTLNYREIIGCQLAQPLIVGQKYFIKMHINKSPGGTANTYGICTDKIGVNFSNTLYSFTNPAPVTNSAVFYCDTIITDAMGWYKASGSFMVNQSYQYAMFGNFFDEANTDTSSGTQFSIRAYYFIDDLCISTDSLFCDVFTYTNNPINNASIKVLYDLSKGILFISDLINQAPILMTVYDVHGKKMFNKVLSEQENEINISAFPNGIYVIHVSNNKLNYQQKILIHN